MLVNVKKDCEHSASLVYYPLEKFKAIDFDSLKCESCEENKEIWICLTCGKSYCSRYINCHFQKHFGENPTHSICLSLADLSIWCNLCEVTNEKEKGSYIETKETSEFKDIIYKYKFKEENKPNKGEEEKKESDKNIDTNELIKDFSSKLNLQEENKEENIIKKTPEEISKEKYEEFIKLLKENKLKKIAFMVGAGISTSSGIPDFRSEGGIFEQLKKKYSLSNAEEVFDLQTFYKNPRYFNEFAREFLKQKYEPTKFHYFMGFLCKKGIVKYVMTQNIDCLEAKSILDQDKVVYAHGNFLEAHCPKCRKTIDFNDFNTRFLNGEKVECKDCNYPCKYKIVFYGESLDEKFFKVLNDIKDVDCAIISGTSLKVGPFNVLPHCVGKDAWRIIVDLFKVAETEFKYDIENSYDVYIKNYSDEFVSKVVKDCEWEKEFEEYIEEAKKHFS